MRVSIIIPIYKVEKEIERCLLSVISQDYHDIECILVNDCTPDNSFKYAQLVVEKFNFFDRVKFIEHKRNKGLSAARDSGIRVATGDYLLFLDSDDALEKDSIKLLVTAAERYKQPDLVVAGHQRIIGNQKIKKSGLKEIYIGDNPRIYQSYIDRNMELNDYAWGKLIKRSFLIENSLFFKHNIYFEDTLWGFSLYRTARSLVSIPNIIQSYYDREGSITSHITEKHISDFNTVIELMYLIFKQRSDYFPIETQREIERRRRENLDRIGCLEYRNRTFILQELYRLKKINITLLTNKFSYFKQNILFRMPLLFIYSRMEKKWGRVRIVE